MDAAGGTKAEEARDGSAGRESSEVVEYRAHEDGMLQKEVRVYTRKDGTESRRGPYWYFRFHEGGKQRTMYIGKTDDPEGKLKEKR